MAVPRLQGVPCDNADSDAQEFFKVLEQADVIKEGGARLEVHEQVKIAVWASLSPCDRAEHGDPMSPAFPRDAEDLRAAAAQPDHGQRIIDHHSTVPLHTWALAPMTPFAVDSLSLALPSFSLRQSAPYT